jgi:hypothetical protein
MWDTKIRELIDRLFIEANGNKSAFEEALREADIEFVSSESDIVVVPLIHPLIFRRRSFATVGTNFD